MKGMCSCVCMGVCLCVFCEEMHTFIYMYTYMTRGMEYSQWNRYVTVLEQSPRPGMTLRTADTISRKRNNNNAESDRRGGKCESYVSNLHPDTSTHEVLRYLKANYSGYFKLEQIRNHFNGYSSFKIEAPLTLKSKLLNKNNWNADVYVRPFFKKSRNY